MKTRLLLPFLLCVPAVAGDEWIERAVDAGGPAPLAAWDFRRPGDAAAWKPNDGATVSPAAEGLALATRGGDPFLTHRLPRPLRGPVAVRLRLTQPEEMMYLDLYAAVPGGGFGDTGHVRRLSLGAPDPQVVWFTLELPEFTALRLDPPGGAHRLVLHELSVHALAAPRAAGHPELPKPTWRNSFFLLPIHETFDDARYTDAARRRDMERLEQEVGPGRLYLRTGFSGSSPQAWRKVPAPATVRLLAEKNLAWHAHHHVGNHSIGRYAPLLEAVRRDRRNAAWRADGDARGSARGWDDARAFVEEGEARGSVLLCVSRLNRDVTAARREAARWLNEDMGHARAAREFPWSMVSAGCSVENELPMSPHAFGCYSPHSVQEFQDWLRHRGPYDAAAPFARQAAPEAHTGPRVAIGGVPRSPFHDDPTPADANGTGPSFNERFGTAFQSWKLEYWNFADFPPGALPWSADLANVLPTEGERGNLPGHGFDAPRDPDPASPLWNAWDSEDRAAPGYRQHSVWAWNQDTVEDFAATGFPRERLFTHQIPAEFLGPRVLPAAGFRSGTHQPNLRRFTTASPTWTADDLLGDYGGFGPGITAFDYMTDEAVPARARALDANWALLEYHPDSPGQPGYPRCLDSLRGLFRQRVHVLAPGWWGYKKPPFLFEGTGFTRALRDWMDNPSGLDDSDQPWDSAVRTEYRPPAVTEFTARAQPGGGVRLAWSPLLWTDVPHARWTLWREFAGGHFEVRRDGVKVAEVPAGETGFTDAASGRQYEVLAVRVKDVRLAGPAVTASP